MITFLFGSGADTDANKDLLSGQSFAASLIGENYKEEIQSLLGAGFARKKIIYPASSKVFIQTVVSFPEKAKGILDDSDIQNCVNHYGR